MMVLNGFKSRIEVENAVMTKQMPQFKFYQRGYERFFEGWYKTSVGNNSYLLKLVVSNNFPDEMPKLFVISPKALQLYRLEDVKTVNIVNNSLVFSGSQKQTMKRFNFTDSYIEWITINSLGCTHDFHTNSNGPGGCVQICHFSPANWDASKTCVSVMIKAVLWCEAYDVHMVTGLSIATIVDQFKRRQEWKLNSNALGTSSLEWLREMTSDIRWSSILEQNQYVQYPLRTRTLMELLK